MVGHRLVRLGVLIGIAVALSVGTRADAFGPARTGSAPMPEPAAVAGTTGASAPSGPIGADPGSSAATPPPTGSPPGPSPATKPTPPAKPPATTKPNTDCAQGERQLEVETALAQIGSYGPVSVDGHQSPADCAAIRRFQQRFGISPANGRAGTTTASVARRIATSLTTAELAKCGAGAGLTACVDLTQQTVWVVRDGVVVLGPTVTRTGMAGFATPAGTYRINFRNIREWSDPYKVWLPYWQHFYNGMGFHQTTTYIHNGSIGSHGCVNLLAGDAKTMWNLIGYGTTVRVFGRRPGT
jgi:lipoprotein-anchoring transpeptidase ErfK/SrfK